jgi:hypothetical protein
MADPKPHPGNPYGVLVPCATCGREIHVPRVEIEEQGVDPGGDHLLGRVHGGEAGGARGGGGRRWRR